MKFNVLGFIKENKGSILKGAVILAGAAVATLGIVTVNKEDPMLELENVVEGEAEVAEE